MSDTVTVPRETVVKRKNQTNIPAPWCLLSVRREGNSKEISALSIHISPNDPILFLLMAEHYSIIWMIDVASMFVQSQVDRHLECFVTWIILGDHE